MTRGPARRVERAEGFTLIELLVVMIILGVLAAIAVPVLINQRGKAHDTATRSDVRRVGLAVQSWYLGSTVTPVVAVAAGHYQVGGEDHGAASAGVIVDGVDPVLVDTAGWTPSAWCLSLRHPEGVQSTFRFSAQRGLEPGHCSSTTAP